jgi:hypothetical protein
MYKCYRIRNFKLFRELDIGEFQRVNLITGRNNSGKTAVLEALFIHSGAANVRLPFSIESFRGITQFQGGLGEATEGLFSDFSTKEPIRLEGVDKLDITRACTIRVVSVPTTLEQPLPDERIGAQAHALEVTFDDPSAPPPVSARAVLERDKLRLDPAPVPPLYQGVFISSKAGTDHVETAKRFSDLTKNVGEEDRFVEAMRVIEPSIRGVRLLSHGGISMLHADVGMKKFLPFAYAGEGMGRLAAMLVAIAASRNGVALIDEIENGLHYSILPDVWRATSEFAERFNVQVFATTHSEECVRAAHGVFATKDYAFRLFRLHRSADGRTEAKMFDREALEAALKSGLETR